MKATRSLVPQMVVVLGSLLAFAALGHASETRMSMDLHDALLRDVLEMFRQSGAMGSYTLAAELGGRRVSADIHDEPQADALKTVLNQVGLVAVNDNGTLIIRDARPVAPEARRTAPASPPAQPVAIPNRTPPSVLGPALVSNGDTGRATARAAGGRNNGARRGGRSGGGGRGRRGGRRGGY